MQVAPCYHKISLPFIFQRVKMNSDLIMVRGDSRSYMDFRDFLLMFVSCSRVRAHRRALQGLLLTHFCHLMHLKGHISYCVRLRSLFIAFHCFVSHKLWYNRTLGCSPSWFVPHSSAVHFTEQDSHYTNCSFVRHGCNFFSAPQLWCLWCLSNLSRNSHDVWFIIHPVRKRLIMCSQGPRSTFTRNKFDSISVEKYLLYKLSYSVMM